MGKVSTWDQKGVTKMPAVETASESPNHHVQILAMIREIAECDRGTKSWNDKIQETLAFLKDTGLLATQHHYTALTILIAVRGNTDAIIILRELGRWLRNPDSPTQP